MIAGRVPTVVLAALALSPVGDAAAASQRSVPWCGKRLSRAANAVWLNREAVARHRVVRSASRARSMDVGDIAVLEDAGDLVLLRNRLDLGGKGIEFVPAGDGYQVRAVDRPVTPATGTRLDLGDDDSTRIELSFGFPFHGRTYDALFVNSDGNLTFGEGDSASTARDLARFLEGPPRIAPLFADLDPSSAGQVVLVSRPDSATITWIDVPQYGEFDSNVFEVTLRAGGAVEFAYAEQLNPLFSQAVVGLAPGQSRGGLQAVDMSDPGGVSSAAALAETFRDATTLDAVAAARRFYQTHADNYFQLVVFSSQRLVAAGTFAYESTVKNTITGIGAGPRDLAALYGSGGNLESFVMMDDIAKYREPFDAPLLGDTSGLSILGQETGHRWLTQAVFHDGSGISHELLGRDHVHWSFFMDSDASHMEGNDIEDQGGGSFQTTAVGRRFSPLDQYLMGLRAPEDVPPFFFIKDPAGEGYLPDSEPEVGVRLNGTRRDVSIEDVVGAMGPRNPPAGTAPNTFRQAFIYVSVGGPPDSADLEKLERLRATWVPFFAASTGGRGAVRTSLD